MFECHVTARQGTRRPMHFIICINVGLINLKVDLQHAHQVVQTCAENRRVDRDVAQQSKQRHATR